MKRAIVFAALMAFLSAPIFSAHAAGITSSDPGVVYLFHLCTALITVCILIKQL
jgi:hypothetical protein